MLRLRFVRRGGANGTTGVGTVSLLIDTGSSNTWVGAGTPFTVTSTTTDTGDLVVRLSSAHPSFERYELIPLQEVVYGSGFVIGIHPTLTMRRIGSDPHPIGEEVLDQVAISDSLVLTNQSIGVAFEDSGFDGVDGILGWVTFSFNVSDDH